MSPAPSPRSQQLRQPRDGCGLLAVYAVTWRRLASPIAAERGRAAFAATAASSRIRRVWQGVEPQYLIWILPIGLALSLTDGRRVCLVLFLAFLALTQTVYPTPTGGWRRSDLVRARWCWQEMWF